MSIGELNSTIKTEIPDNSIHKGICQTLDSGELCTRKLALKPTSARRNLMKCIANAIWQVIHLCKTANICVER